MEPVVEGVRLGELLVVEEYEVAVEFLCNHEVVRDDDDGGLEHGTHVVDQREQVSTVVVVETGGRFVHQEEFRVHGPRPCDGDALLHAHAQLVGEHVREFADAHQVHGHLDLFLDFCFGPYPVIAERERDVVDHSQVRDEGCVLEHVPDLPLGDFERGEALCRDVFAEVVDMAFERARKPCNHAEDGALAFAGGASDANRFAQFECQVCTRD